MLQNKFGPMIHLPDGIAWLISTCLCFSALRKLLILTNPYTPFAERQGQICKESPLHLALIVPLSSSPPPLALIVPLSSHLENKLLFATAKYFISPKHCHFSAPQFLCFLPCWVSLLCQRSVALLDATFPWSCTSWKTSLDRRWVFRASLVSVSFELIVLLDNFRVPGNEGK